MERVVSVAINNGGMIWSLPSPARQQFEAAQYESAMNASPVSEVVRIKGYWMPIIPRKTTIPQVNGRGQ